MGEIPWKFESSWAHHPSHSEEDGVIYKNFFSKGPIQCPTTMISAKLH